MTTPTPESDQEREPEHDSDQGSVPPAGPAYSTPPPEGLPDADSG